MSSALTRGVALADHSQSYFWNISDAELEGKLLKTAHPYRAAEIGSHVREHLTRFKLLFASVGSAREAASLLDVGGTGNMLPIYLDDLAYSFVAMANKWRSKSLDCEYLTQFVSPDRFRCDYFDAEAEEFPYDDESFNTVVCSEVIEHLKYDPAHMLREINRVLITGGRLILTTPNITSDAALYRLLSGQHPQLWSAYTGIDGDRHNREYTPKEIRRLLEWAGFGQVHLQTFSLEPTPFKIKFVSYWTLLPWSLRGQSEMSRYRGEYILAIASKHRAATEKYPIWLFDSRA